MTSNKLPEAFVEYIESKSSLFASEIIKTVELFDRFEYFLIYHRLFVEN